MMIPDHFPGMLAGVQVLELLNIPAQPMKSTPADHRAADRHECLVNVIAFVEARAQASELVQQRDRLLDDVPEKPKAAAVFFAATGITDGYLLEGVEYWPDGASEIWWSASSGVRSERPLPSIPIL